MDKIQELKKLKTLLDDEVISQKEFDELKSEVLDNKILRPIVSSVELDEKEKAENTKNGNLNILFRGEGGLFDSKTELYINGKLHSTQSTKKGFSVDIPIEGVKIELTIVWRAIFKFKTVYSLDELEKGKSYNMQLKFDNQRGYLDKFNFSEGN